MSKKSNFQIAFELGAKMDPSMKKNFNQANKQLSGFGKKVGSLVKTGAKMAVGMGTAFVGVSTAAFAMTKKVVNAFDDIAINSRKLGVSSDFYQEMDYWAQQNGLSHENMEKAVGRFNQRLGLAMNGSDKYSKALDKMGVNLDDVKNGSLSTEEAYVQSIKSLSEMENQQDQVALATQFFGTKLARNLLPALQDGSLSIDEAREKAQELGLVIGEDSLEAAEEFQATWNTLTGIFQKFGQKVISKLIPHFQKLMDWILTNMPAIQSKISDVFQKAGEIMGMAFAKVQPAIEWLTNDGIPIAIEVINNLKERAIEFYNFISKNWSTIKPLLIGIATAALILKTSIVALTVIQSITKFMKMFKVATMAGRLAMLGLNTAMLANPAFWIIAAFLAVIAIGIAVWKNWDTIKEYLLMAWDAIKIGASAVKEGIVNAFTSAYEWVKNIYMGIGEWFFEKFMSIVQSALTIRQAIIDAFGSAWEAIKGFFGGIGSWFSGVMGNVIGAFKGGINGVIGFANSAINSLNSISVSLPDWLPGGLGGRTFGVHIPNIPYLAEGGITTGATMAMIGEGAEQEAILPLSKLQALLDMPDHQTNNNDNSAQIHYNPKIIIQGNANQIDIERALMQDEKRIERLFEKYFEKRKRLSLK